MVKHFNVIFIPSEKLLQYYCIPIKNQGNIFGQGNNKTLDLCIENIQFHS